MVTLGFWEGDGESTVITGGQRKQIMRKQAAALRGLLISAFLITGIVANSAIAQEKVTSTAKMTVLLENDKVRVYETTYAPGAENKTVATSSVRIVRAIKGGTLQRTYADGKTENVVWKSGEVRQIDPGATYSVKNIGKTEMDLYIVQVK